MRAYESSPERQSSAKSLARGNSVASQYCAAHELALVEVGAARRPACSASRAAAAWSSHCQPRRRRRTARGSPRCGRSIRSTSPAMPVAPRCCVTLDDRRMPLGRAASHHAGSTPRRRARARWRARSPPRECRSAAPPPAHGLAPEQIEPLDAGRALVDAVELLIAQPRLGQVLARVAVAAVDLDRERVGLEALLRGKRLGHRGSSKSSSSPARCRAAASSACAARSACSEAAQRAAKARPRRWPSGAAACAARRRAR